MSSPLARCLADLERMDVHPGHTCLVNIQGDNLLEEVDSFDGLIQLQVATQDIGARVIVIQETADGHPRLLLDTSRDVQLFLGESGETDFRIRASALARCGLAHSSSSPHAYVLASSFAPSADGAPSADKARPAVGEADPGHIGMDDCDDAE